MFSGFANILGDLANTFYSDVPLPPQGRDQTPPVEDYPAVNSYAYSMPPPFTYDPYATSANVTDQIKEQNSTFLLTPSASPELKDDRAGLIDPNVTHQNVDQSLNQSLNQTLNESAVEKKTRRRSKKVKTDENDSTHGQSRECVICHKEIESRNVNRHAMFHTKVFRFSCSICDYQSHMKFNVKTHLRLKHDIKEDGSKIIENLSQELGMEIARVFEECFPGQTKTAYSLKSYTGRNSIECSYLNDSAISMNTTVNETMKDSPQQKYEGIIQKRTCSNRLLRSLEKQVMYPCQRCDKLVGRPKQVNHSITHASTHRYRCSSCGVGHHCHFNLRTHIKTQHENQADVVDEMTPDLQAEYDSLLIECFPEMAGSRRSINSTLDQTPDSIDSTIDRTIDLSTSINEGDTIEEVIEVPVTRSKKRKSNNIEQYLQKREKITASE